MRKLASLFLFLLVAFPSIAVAQKEEKKIMEEDVYPPDPLVLKEGWRDYLNVPDQELPDRVNSWRESLKQVAEDAKNGRSEEINKELEKILLDLDVYQKIREQTLVRTPNVHLFEESYTIDQVLDVFQGMRAEKNELKVNRRALESKEKYAKRLESQILNLLSAFYDAPERSEERLVIGFKIIEKELGLLIVEDEIEELLDTLDYNLTEIELWQKELDNALEHVQTTPEETRRLKEEQAALQEDWEEEREQLEQLERKAMAEVTVGAGQESLSANEWWEQVVLQASIEEAIVFTRSMMANLKIVFLELHKPGVPKNIEELFTQVEEWRNQLDLIEEKFDGWVLTAQKGQQESRKLITYLEEGGLSLEEVQQVEVEKEVVKTAQENFLDLQVLSEQIKETIFLLDVVEEDLIGHLGGTERWYKQFWFTLAKVWKAIATVLNQPLINWGRKTITLLNVLYSLLIMFVAFWGAHIIQRALGKVARGQRAAQRSLIYRLSRLIKYFIIAVGIIIATIALGFDFTTFFLVAGALGVGIGFGLQEIFRNFISGIIILFESHLKVGDFIELAEGASGTVREINFRNTVVTTNDGIDILVPNSEMVNSQVTNWTLREPYRRIHVPFSVAYGTDKDLVKQLVVEAANNIPHTLKRGVHEEPMVVMNKLGDSGLEMELLVWVREKVTPRLQFITSEYLWEVERILRENDIEIPFPQIEVRKRKSTHE